LLFEESLTRLRGGFKSGTTILGDGGQRSTGGGGLIGVSGKDLWPLKKKEVKRGGRAKTEVGL